MSGSKSVLVVDDSLVARMMVKEIIRKAFPDWRVVEAKDPQSALDLTEGESLDFMVVDYNMENMNGLELAARLQERFPGIRGALLTANIQDVLRDRARAQGLAFISKPIKPDPLVAFLNGD